ncbi:MULTISPECIES: hypothetical protein [unclassified Brevundimonas]|uniref:hypothetical protein n=1 Tax=unclassified Brevundimonas TaxID=2622653 RepID=UPI0025B8472C|nr:MULTISPECIES: hypothetical protein [unclassified Brevundimonas]
MARAQFQKGQKVWVESVGAWAQIEKVLPVWAKGFDEPVRITYEVGLGREFQAAELQLPAEDNVALTALGDWRVLRARNKWQEPADCAHHPFPGSYPVVVTDKADWGGWRVPGAEYDRDPERIEFQSRLIAASPDLMNLARELVETVSEAPDDAPPESLRLARRARDVLRQITDVLAAPDDAPRATTSAADEAV